MKFKLNYRFQSQIREYLIKNGIQFNWEEQQQSGAGTLTVHANTDYTIKIKHLIAQKLLNEYHKQKIANPQLKLTDWIKDYASIFNNLNQTEVETVALNQTLMVHKYNELKKIINEKKQVLARNIKQNQTHKQQYLQRSKLQQERVKLNLQNIQYRLALKQTNGNQSNQQLERIQNLLKNGVWGMLPQIQAKLKHIIMLQREIEQLKRENQNKTDQ